MQTKAERGQAELKAKYLVAEQAFRREPSCRRRRAALRLVAEQLAAALLAADKYGILKGTVES
jgi:hypothetical protein